jgi:hypothetical protein
MRAVLGVKTTVSMGRVYNVLKHAEGISPQSLRHVCPNAITASGCRFYKEKRCKFTGGEIAHYHLRNENLMAMFS